MNLAIRLISTDKGVRNDTTEEFKELNSQSLSSQAKNEIS